MLWSTGRGQGGKRRRHGQSSKASQAARESVPGSGLTIAAPEEASSSGRVSSELTEAGPSARPGSQRQGRLKKRRVQDAGGFGGVSSGRGEQAQEGVEVVAGDLKARIAAILRGADLEMLTLQQVSTAEDSLEHAVMPFCCRMSIKSLFKLLIVFL